MNKDSLLLEEAYKTILEKKKKKPDDDGDGVPNWADKHPGKDDHKVKKAKKEGLEFKALYQSILEESVSEEELKDCMSIIKKLSKGNFKNESEKTIKKVKSCKSVFSVSKDKEGHYTVVIKDSALKELKKHDENLAKKFMSAAECKKDVARCRAEKKN